MINRLPPWFRQEIPRDFNFIKKRLSVFENSRIRTVCVSAQCPNLYTCFKNSSVTFMIMGDSCSRNCSFCAVGKGKLKPLDLLEPYNLALNIRELNLEYIVITSVTRDDLILGGATHFARVVYLVKRLNPHIKLELLIPDFKGNEKAIFLLVRAPLDIIAHNIETVERLYPYVRPKGNYRRALSVLKKIKKLRFAGFVKSGIMLGLGEREDEVIEAMQDLYSCGCDIISLGQYLAPSKDKTKVKEFITPEKFEFYKNIGIKLGFKSVNSSPLMRSSFNAKEAFLRCG